MILDPWSPDLMECCQGQNSFSLLSSSNRLPGVLEKAQSRPRLRLGPQWLGGRGGELLIYSTCYSWMSWLEFCVVCYIGPLSALRASLPKINLPGFTPGRTLQMLPIAPLKLRSKRTILLVRPSHVDHCDMLPERALVGVKMTQRLSLLCAKQQNGQQRFFILLKGLQMRGYVHTESGV